MSPLCIRNNFQSHNNSFHLIVDRCFSAQKQDKATQKNSHGIQVACQKIVLI